MAGPTPKTVEEPERAPRVAVDAERRQLSLLFCDTVGATRIAEELGPEDWWKMLQDHQASVAEVVERFEGTVAQYLGDGVLAYFGYPRAHEDDAERAVRAGLAIVNTVTARAPQLEGEFGCSISVRIGIHTGPVVVGKIGGGGHHETLAVGVASNLAARVQAKAQPDTVLISESTRHLVRGIFSTEDCGLHHLAGIADPVRLFRPLRPTSVRSRLGAAAVEELTPFVGRAAEIDLLMERWNRARRGRGQVVLVGGEAGIGKSRLANVFRERLAGEPHRWIEIGASKFHGQSAYHPLSNLLAARLGLAQERSSERKLSRLAEGVEDAGLVAAEVAPLFASLLGLAMPERDALHAMSAEARRKRTQEAMVRWLLAQVREAPTVFLVEDLHWLDPSSLDVLGLLMQRVSAARALVIPTFRSAFEVPWPLEPHVAKATLEPLTPAQTEAMVTGVTRNLTLPSVVRDQVVKKTDGVPLFVEEFTRTVLESEALSSTDERSSSPPEFAVPTTLQDSLMSRLDRLGPAKGVAQIASVLGREFSYELLAAVSSSEPSPEEDLSRLVTAGILQRRDGAAGVSYVFKHALIQDTAYGSLLKATRRVWHARIVEAFEEHFAHRAAAEPERLAWHCEEGGLIEKAVDYYRMAGEHASLRSATAETIQHLTRGIELVRSLPEGAARDERELGLQLELGQTLVATKGWASPDAAAAYGHARLLCERIGEPRQVFQVMRGLITYYVGRAELGTAHDLIRRLMELAEQSDESSWLLLAHEQIGILRYFEGKHADALEHFERAIALYKPSEHGHLAHLHGEDLGVFTRIWMAWALWIVGYPDRAKAMSYEALGLGREAAHPFSLAYAFLWTAILHVMRREPETAGQLASEAIAIAEEQGFAFVLAGGKLIAAWAQLQAPLDVDAMAAAAESFKDAVAGVGTTGNMANAPMMMGYLADAYGRAGLIEQAMANVETGLALSQATRQTQWDSELHRIKGELLLEHHHDVDEAERAFQRALEIARSQQSRSLELRAALSLAKMCADRSQKNRSRELLEPIYASFSEGFESPDLVEARRLLGIENDGGATDD